MWLLLAALVVQQPPISVPKNISKVPRQSSDVCQLQIGVTELQAGVSYELVFFVDAVLRYQTIQVSLSDPFSVTHAWSRNVSDQSPLCPSGGPNQNQRPHVMPLLVVTPGRYWLEAFLRSDATPDAMRIDAFWITVK